MPPLQALRLTGTHAPLLLQALADPRWLSSRTGQSRKPLLPLQRCPALPASRRRRCRVPWVRLKSPPPAGTCGCRLPRCRQRPGRRAGRPRRQRARPPLRGRGQQRGQCGCGRVGHASWQPGRADGVLALCGPPGSSAQRRVGPVQPRLSGRLARQRRLIANHGGRRGGGWHSARVPVALCAGEAGPPRARPLHSLRRSSGRSSRPAGATNSRSGSASALLFRSGAAFRDCTQEWCGPRNMHGCTCVWQGVCAEMRGAAWRPSQAVARRSKPRPATASGHRLCLAAGHRGLILTSSAGG